MIVLNDCILLQQDMKVFQSVVISGEWILTWINAMYYPSPEIICHLFFNIKY